jgi:deazaflavin-dependent oxidoreductase (nitroreductase family)
MAQASPLSNIPARAPAFIRNSGPITSRLLRLGLPLGPNRVLIIRGRRSGEPYRIPLAVAEVHDRRFVIGTFGDTNWVRNLRAAGEAELMVRGRAAAVRARELSRKEAVEFFRVTLRDYLHELPIHWRAFVAIFLRLAAPELMSDPQQSADRHPVFELSPVRG